MSEEDVRNSPALGKVRANGITERVVKQSGSWTGDEAIAESRTGEIEDWSTPASLRGEVVRDAGGGDWAGSVCPASRSIFE